MALTTRVSFIPAVANVGTTYNNASPPTGFTIASPDVADVRNLGWLTDSTRGAAMRTTTARFRLALTGASITASLASVASNVASWWNIDVMYAPGQLTTVGGGLELIDVSRSAPNDLCRVFVTAMSAANVASVTMRSARGGAAGTSTFTLPFDRPMVLRLHMKQIAASTWVYDCELLYSFDGGQTWTSAGTLTNCHAFNTVAGIVRVGIDDTTSGTGNFRITHGGVVVSQGTVDADRIAATPILIGGTTLEGSTHYLDVETVTDGDGSLATPFSLANAVACLSGTSNYDPKAITVYQRSGVDYDSRQYPDLTAEALIQERLAGTLTVHSNIPTIRILSKLGVKQRTSSANVITFTRPVVIDSDSATIKPYIWHTKPVTAWSQPNFGTVPNIWEATDSSTNAYLFQSGLPLESSLQANIAAARTWVNAAAGRMWTDGTTMLVRARGDIDPSAAASGTFERTKNNGSDFTGVGLLREGVVRNIRSYATTLRNPTTEIALIGGYCFGHTAPAGLVIIENMEGDFADKHVSGATPTQTGHVTTLWINNTQGRCAAHATTTGFSSCRVEFTNAAAAQTGLVNRNGYYGDVDLYATQSQYAMDGTDVGANLRSNASWYSHVGGTVAPNRTLRIRANSVNSNPAITTNVTGATVVGVTGGNAAARGWGGIYFPTLPTAAQTITINAVVITFVAGAPGVNEVQIAAADIPTTISRLNTLINANTGTLLVTSVIQAHPYIEHYIARSSFTAGGTIYSECFQSPMKIEDSTVYGIANFNSVTVDRCIIQSNPFRFGGTVSDSIIQYWPNTPTNATASTRIQDGDSTGGGIAGPYTMTANRCTFDMSGLVVGGATHAVFYTATQVFTLNGVDNLWVLPSTDVAIFQGTAVQVPITATNSRIVSPMPAGTGTAFQTAVTVASHVGSFSGTAYASYAAGKVSTTSRKLLGGSPMIGAATPVVGGKDASGRTFALRNDIGAYEYAPGADVAVLGMARVSGSVLNA